MANNEYKNLWLHDEDQLVTILPYTTLDNIKIQQGDTFTNFKSDYQNLQTTVNSNATRINSLSNSVTTLEGKTMKATTSADGLMSKEDKRKLEDMSGDASGYILPHATTQTLGGVKIDNDTITIDEDGVISTSIDSSLLAPATSSTLGVVKVDNDTITVDNTGTISANISNNGGGVSTAVYEDSKNLINPSDIRDFLLYYPEGITLDSSDYPDAGGDFHITVMINNDYSVTVTGYINELPDAQFISQMVLRYGSITSDNMTTSSMYLKGCPANGNSVNGPYIKFLDYYYNETLAIDTGSGVSLPDRDGREMDDYSSSVMIGLPFNEINNNINITYQPMVCYSLNDEYQMPGYLSNMTLTGKVDNLGEAIENILDDLNNMSSISPASEYTLGGIKTGNGMYMDNNNKLNVTTGYKSGINLIRTYYVEPEQTYTFQDTTSNPNISLTATVNKDYSVTVTGYVKSVVSSLNYKYLLKYGLTDSTSGTLVLKGCPTSGSSTGPCIIASSYWNVSSSVYSSSYLKGKDTGNFYYGLNGSSEFYIYLYMPVASVNNNINITYYPMVYPSDYSSRAYEPFYYDNLELYTRIRHPLAADEYNYGVTRLGKNLSYTRNSNGTTAYIKDADSQNKGVLKLGDGLIYNDSTEAVDTYKKITSTGKQIGKWNGKKLYEAAIDIETTTPTETINQTIITDVVDVSYYKITALQDGNIITPNHTLSIDNNNNLNLNMTINAASAPTKIHGLFYYFVKKMPTIVTWSGGTWPQIKEMLDAHYDGIINIYDYWHVGDYRNVNLYNYYNSSIPAEEGICVSGSYSLTLLNQGGKTLAEPYGDAQMSQCAFIVGWPTGLYNVEKSGFRCQWSNSNYDYYSESKLRQYLNKDIPNETSGHNGLLGAFYYHYSNYMGDIKKVFKQFQNICKRGSDTTQVTVDYFAIPSIEEFIPDTGFSYWATQSYYSTNFSYRPFLHPQFSQGVWTRDLNSTDSNSAVFVVTTPTSDGNGGFYGVQNVASKNTDTYAFIPFGVI